MLIVCNCEVKIERRNDRGGLENLIFFQEVPVADQF